MIKPIVKFDSPSNQFVGIKIENNVPVISFPLGVRLSNPNDYNDLREYVLYLTKAISQVKSFNKEKKYVNEKNNVVENFPFFDYIWLLNDFINNGIFSSKEKITSKNNSGRINWKKTINGSKLLQRKKIFFYNLYSDKYISNDNYITRLHEYCLNEANKICGWFFGNVNVPTSILENIDVTKNVYYLKSKLAKIFDDRFRMLIQCMINIFEYRTGDYANRGVYEYGTYNYEVVWELLMSKILSNTNIEDYYQSAYYNFKNFKVRASSKMKPDALLIKEHAYLLDAKYYQYGIKYNVENLPPTSDIQKQVAYGEYVKMLMDNEGKKTYNMFLIPYSKSELNSSIQNFGKDIEFIGFAQPEWINKANKNLHNLVSIILVDANFALKNFSRVSKDAIYDLLINEAQKIEEHINY